MSSACVSCDIRIQTERPTQEARSTFIYLQCPSSRCANGVGSIQCQGYGHRLAVAYDRSHRPGARRHPHVQVSEQRQPDPQYKLPLREPLLQLPDNCSPFSTCDPGNLSGCGPLTESDRSRRTQQGTWSGGEPSWPSRLSPSREAWVWRTFALTRLSSGENLYSVGAAKPAPAPPAAGSWAGSTKF